MPKFYIQIVILFLLFSCTGSKKDNTISVAENPLFILLDSSNTNVMFNNVLKEDLEKKIVGFYQGFYSGGGVAVGDLNNDGLDDIYFSGNMTGDKLYRNLGNMRFADITEISGVAGRTPGWKTGVNMVDVNGDGYMDIYVCYAGREAGPDSKNQLFINQGLNKDSIPTFKDEAEAYGLADPSYSTQSVFFDYDRDGDLDLFLVNDNIKVLSNLDDITIEELKKQDDPLASSKLLKNENGHFKDVTKQAGINMSTLSYGLGGGVGDINGDGWPDIYLSNDYAIPDRMYLNNGNGTFTDKLQNNLDHISLFSMGNNISDVNNDGLQDIFTLDMLPEDNKRQKLLSGLDNYEVFNINLRNGFYYQYMRNMLHINNGNGTFSEVGQLAGISNTDWSWAPLFADYDNDGWKDLFITNGFMRDFTNMDVLKYNENYMRSLNGQVEAKDLIALLKKVPSSDVKNYIYKNNGDLTFTNKGFDWGINIPSNSNGAAYSDLDNDGDLDIIVNNINKAAFLYRNQGSPTMHYLKVKLKGSGKNTSGLGALVTIFNKGRQQCLEQMPSKGYLSSVSQNLHFGLGKEKMVDSVRIVWLSGKYQVLTNVVANKQLVLIESDAKDTYQRPKPSKPLFTEIPSPIASAQVKNEINDYKRQPLLVNAQSFTGPCMAKGDVNGDGLSDIFVGGDINQASALFIQQKGGKFMKNQKPFLADTASECTDAIFFDANGDSHPDLYVVSGGYGSFKDNDPLFQDKLYINDGKGNFTKSINSLPEMHVSKSCARVGDFNGDGRPDLFVGGRSTTSKYPETPRSFLLINDGKGHFSNQIRKIAPDLEYIGMVTDAGVLDLNNDKIQDLIVIGDWMPVTAFINDNGKLKNRTDKYFDKQYSGWWNTLKVEDLNGDGRPDLVVGNLGLNSQCRVSDDEPAEMVYKDFDDNGAMDPILCFYIMGKSYPYLTRDEILDQMSIMRTRFPDYKSYADAGLNEVFTAEELKGSKILKANYLKTVYFENTSDGRFKEKQLPLQAQFAPVYTITCLDYDGDGNKDLLLCGNINQSRIRFGKYDANHGVVLKGNGKGTFKYVPELQSGLSLKGDVRSTLTINNTLLIGINQQKLRAFRFNQN
ncbi:VCBS repeat-containing protein [Pedobacter panaciterrae]|uniref:VCBS repeat-containing protein n=1 Tax=Pedobacter panaciterrae TaxID=363849 RepID=A0ABU8NIA3_9SPHI